MTVAAIVLVPDVDRALSDADGEPAIRRVAQSAWAGGALPIVVVSAQTGDDAAVAASDARLASALADLAVVLTHPAPHVPPGAAWFAHGLAVASGAVTETSGALLWPFRYTWVDPETVTSLVEAHGASRDAIVRPAYEGEPGFPILVPLGIGREFADRPEIHGWQAIEAAASAGAPFRLVDLGDPGIVRDLATPRSQLPAYQGPPEPAGGGAPEWNQALGEAAAAGAAGSPQLDGPALAPYEQAGDAAHGEQA